MQRWIGALLAVAIAGAVAWADGLYVPFSMPATTCTNQFVRSIAVITGIGTCASVANADLTNSSVTVNGTTCTLGSTCVPAIVATKVTFVGSSQTVTRATGVKSAIIECWGAGGGGAGAGGSATGVTTGGSGGSGSYASVFVNSPASDYVVTIGAAGTGGATGTNDGASGGDTTVTGPASCTGKGGSAGTQNGAGVGGTGGAGGVSGTGTFTIAGNGGEGGIGASITTIQPFRTRGGAGPLGGASNAGVVGGGSTSPGGNGFANSGAGGGGGATNGTISTAAGGNGGSGGVRITEFVNQ